MDPDRPLPDRPLPDRTVESPTNQLVKDLVGLQTRRRQRVGSGRVVVEGHDEIGLVVAGGAAIEALCYCPGLWRAPDPSLLVAVRAAGGELVELGEQAFRKAAYRDGPDGWLAIAASPERPLDGLELGPAPLLLACEGVEKPGNLGAMLRTADAAGVDACVAVAPGTDWGNPNLIRSSKGTVFTVPVVSTSVDDWFRWVAARALTVVAATPAAPLDFTEADLSGGAGGVVVAVGAERQGLSSRFLERADQLVRIPMVGVVNSLNVAMSAGLLLYEVRRQRGLAPSC